jgi:hypothetical protein
LELKDNGDFFVTALAPGAMETAMLQQVCAAGEEVPKVVDIKEPVNFAASFHFPPIVLFLVAWFMYATSGRIN